MRDLADCFIYLLRLLAAIKLIVETAAATTQVRQPRRKANDEPFFKIERLKKNFFISSNASPNGLKISIFGSAPFMAHILKRFGQQSMLAE